MMVPSSHMEQHEESVTGIDTEKTAKKCLKKIGLPAIIRPSFTLGGLGGGIARTKKDF
mgnify:CR=1 FL=1